MKPWGYTIVALVLGGVLASLSAPIWVMIVVLILFIVVVMLATA